ncbi:uncharacterized protein LOC129226408 [Uloborus diversus]|uniref:uncharacterized protein LOC129226408 n=1 Tax=Uloborus diversus TaxID=327109 RepID=UPI0024097F58|nr:uncharacterized protein LOC129226408 [Uloborus diversus]
MGDPNIKRPPHELLLAQLILSGVIIGLVVHATYQKSFTMKIPNFDFTNGQITVNGYKEITLDINAFSMAHTVLLLLSVSVSYFVSNAMLYGVNKLSIEPILNHTILILLQDVVFCVLMLVGGIATIAYHRAEGGKQTELLIAAGISLFCSVSSGVGVYYSYKVYQGQ